METYTPDVTPPAVNINGRDKRSLLEQHTTTLEKLRDAQKALMEMMPHGRDFQTLPNAMYQKARDQHRARIVAVERVIMDIETLAVLIADQRG